MSNRDDFPSKVQSKLAERAGYICSNPLCNRITMGPSSKDHSKSIKTGEAAHICAASAGGARYDPKQTPSERSSIKNGIWLCATCATMIDKNKGNDYPIDDLKKWKKDHEQLMKDCLEGKKRIIFQFKTTVDQSTVIRKLTKFLENRGVLFVDYHHEVPTHVYSSINEIRTYLIQIQVEVIPESPLEVIIDSMTQACRHFMNTTNSAMDMKQMEYSLGAMRKIVGLNLSDLMKVYDIKIKGDLIKIIPSDE